MTNRVTRLVTTPADPLDVHDQLKPHPLANTVKDVHQHIDSTSDPAGCHQWTRSRNKKGYGVYAMSGKLYLAHRVVWIDANGPIPAGMLVCHRCDNPPCCRLDHLFLATQAENVADRDAKGRHRPCPGDKNGARRRPDRLARGDKNGSRLYPDRRPRGDNNSSRLRPERLARGEAVVLSKLNEQSVKELRMRHQSGETCTKLAAEFGVSASAVLRAVGRRTWRHVV